MSRRLIGQAPAMRELWGQIDRVAASPLPALILGETGVGKELVARAIHERSPRRSGPFVPEPCAAMSEDLACSELFGHERGAFTGAVRDREGVVTQADGGTLFLDELEEMPRALQAKLLRVVETGEVRRVGGEEPRLVDVRVLSASQRSVAELFSMGGLRSDLLYRLAVLHVHVPPLRARLEDLPQLAAQALARAASRGQEPRISEAALDAMLAYDWPGNVRELESVLSKAALTATDGVITPRGLGLGRPATPPARDLELTYEEFCALQRSRERAYFEAALASSRGVRAEAARSLGMSRYSLRRTLRRLGLDSTDAA
jgi:DNA-binding NtrC family response regulator